jgi:hypothetical protein
VKGPEQEPALASEATRAVAEDALRLARATREQTSTTFATIERTLRALVPLRDAGASVRSRVSS